MTNEKLEKIICETGKKRMAPDERIEVLDKKIEQLKRQRQAIENREKERERKERTRRLIQNGALAEKYLQCEEFAPDAFESFLKRLIEIPSVDQFLNEGGQKCIH